MNADFCLDYYGQCAPDQNGGVICNIPSTPIGFTSYRTFEIKIKKNGQRLIGSGYGWSYQSQAMADAMASSRAIEMANFLNSL